MNEMLRKHYLVRFNRKSGRIDTTMEALGFATLKLWGIQNTTGGKDTIVFDAETGKIAAYYEGTAAGEMPIIDEPDDENIEKYCSGLLEALNAEI